MRDHEMKVRLDNGYLSLSMDCPFDAADKSRPCWPHTDGEPDADPVDPSCVYESWLENCMPEEILSGDWAVTVGCDWEWRADSPVVTLHPVPELVEAVRTHDTLIRRLIRRHNCHNRLGEYQCHWCGTPERHGHTVNCPLDAARVLLTDQTTTEEL